MMLLLCFSVFRGEEVRNQKIARQAALVKESCLTFSFFRSGEEEVRKKERGEDVDIPHLYLTYPSPMYIDWRMA
jgi:hypothetical protein